MQRPEPEPVRIDAEGARPDPAPAAADEADIFAKIERLAALHAKGILSDQEYQSKKAELLDRI